MWRVLSTTRATDVKTSARTVMYAKLLILCCACAAVCAAPGYLDGIGLGHGFTAPALAAPIAHTFAAPAISHAIAAPAITTHAIAAPAITHAVAAPVVHAEPVDPNPAYSFAYGVNDPHTGDHKDAQETLQNGVVHGSYSLVEPDGHIRKVTYTADKVNGFNAVVERSGATHAAPVAVAAPIAKVVAAPAHVVAAPIGHGWR